MDVAVSPLFSDLYAGLKYMNVLSTNFCITHKVLTTTEHICLYSLNTWSLFSPIAALIHFPLSPYLNQKLCLNVQQFSLCVCMCVVWSVMTGEQAVDGDVQYRLTGESDNNSDQVKVNSRCVLCIWLTTNVPSVTALQKLGLYLFSLCTDCMIPCHLCSVMPTELAVGRDTPFSPCPFTFSCFALFYFSLSFIGFTYFLLLSIPSLSTRRVPLCFQVTECGFSLLYLICVISIP